MAGTSSSRMLTDVLGMLASDAIGVAIGRSVATSAQVRKAAAVDPLEPPVPLGSKVGREVDGKWETHGRTLGSADAPDGVETPPAHRYHSPGHAHWVTIHGHAVYIDDHGLFHFHGKDSPGTRPGDANWHASTTPGAAGPGASGNGKDGKAPHQADRGDTAATAEPTLVPVKRPAVQGRDQLSIGDELFSLSSQAPGPADPDDGDGDGDGDGDDDVDDGRFLAHVIRTPGGYLVGIGRGWEPKPGISRIPLGEGTHGFDEHVEYAEPGFSPVYPTIGEARAHALAALVHYARSEPKGPDPDMLRSDLEHYSRHHEHALASLPAPRITSLPSLPASRQPSTDPRTSEAIRQQVLALHDPAAVRLHEEFVARTTQVMSDSLAGMAAIGARHAGMAARVADATRRLASPAKGTAPGIRRELKQLEDEREGLRGAYREHQAEYRRSIMALHPHQSAHQAEPTEEDRHALGDPSVPSGFTATRERAWEAILSREPTMALGVVRHDIGVDKGFDDLAEERAREAKLMAMIFGRGRPAKAGNLPQAPPPPPPVEDHIDEITRTTLAFVNRLFAGQVRFAIAGSPEGRPEEPYLSSSARGERKPVSLDYSKVALVRTFTGKGRAGYARTGVAGALGPVGSTQQFWTPVNAQAGGTSGGEVFFPSPTILARQQAGSGMATLAHELGHHLEFTVPGVRAKALAFLERRTAGQAPVPLSSLGRGGYDKDEIAIPDGFLTPYIGKQYPPDHTGQPRATEVVASMVAYLADDPVGFAIRDPDMFRTAMDIFRGS